MVLFTQHSISFPADCFVRIDKLFQVDEDRTVTEDFRDTDEGYQMKDVPGKHLRITAWSDLRVSAN